MRAGVRSTNSQPAKGSASGADATVAGEGDVSWSRAITLEERLAFVRRAPPSPVPVDVRRFGTKRRQVPTRSSPSAHARRIAADELTDAQFQRLVEEPFDGAWEMLLDAPWARDSVEAFSNASFSEPLPLTAAQVSHPLAGILNPLQPLLLRGLKALRDGMTGLVRTQASEPFNPDAIKRGLFAPLASDLLRRMGRTVALEVNVMRLRGQLTAETPQGRFREFTEGLRRPERVLAFWQDTRCWPGRQRRPSGNGRRPVSNCSSVSVPTGTSCSGYWVPQAISGRSSPSAASRDRHQGGRAVTVLEFASGQRIVYKPKAMALAVHFHRLLDWINDRNGDLQFRTTAILDRGNYGWMEYVHAAPCTTRHEVDRFYERQGGYLALLYAIEAADFHLENIIAAGEHPMLIDLEAMFHPRFSEEPGTQDYYAAHRAESESVLRVGVLPFLMFGDSEHEGVDLSGWGGAPGQTTPFEVPAWKDEATDAMRLERRRVPLHPARNRPYLGDTDIDVTGFADQNRCRLHEDLSPVDGQAR